MEVKKFMYKITMLMMAFIFLCSCVCYAEGPQVVGSDELGLPILSDSYKPTVSDSDNVKNIISKLLSVLMVLGVVGIVVAVAIIGFGAILGSASEKANAQGQYIGLLIAALLITGSSALAKILISVADKF